MFIQQEKMMTATDPASPANSDDHEQRNTFDLRGQQVYGDQVNIAGNVYTDEHTYDVRGLQTPYLGLKAFTYIERALYAGRDTEINTAIRRLTNPGSTSSLLFITGASGSGKSSFVQAGLLPALEQYYLQQHYVVRWVLVRPGEHPIVALAGALRTLKLSAMAPFTTAVLSQLLPPAAPLSDNQISILIIDQFEELFSQSEPAQRNEFFALLTALPSFHTLPLHVIATLRADYLPDLFNNKLLYERAKMGVDLRVMEPAQLETAIQRPLQARYPNTKKRWQTALLKRLVSDAMDDAAYLPLLQVTLEDIWRGGFLTIDHYTTLSTAISRRADTVLTQTTDKASNPIPRSPQEQATILTIFLDLVDVSLAEDARSDVRRTRRLTEVTRNRPTALALVHELIAQRLLSSTEKLLDNNENPVQTLDIIHESLIRNWSHLRDAIQAKREYLQQRHRFEQHLADWLDHDSNSDFLLTGVYLAEAENLQGLDDVAVQSSDAKAYLAESIEVRDRIQQAEITRQRALVTEQTKRTQAEAGRARTFRWAATIAILLLLLALMAMTWAVNRQNVATIARSTADANVIIAATQLANAQAAQREAESAAHVAQSRALAASAQIFTVSNPMLAWLLAIEAGRHADTDAAYTAVNMLAPTLPKPIHTFVHDDIAMGAVWNQKETRLLTWSTDHTARIWDTSSGKLLLTFNHNATIWGASWNRSETRLLTWSADHTAKVWNTTDGALLFTLSHADEVYGAQWNSDESHILTWSLDHTAKVWNATSNQLLFTFSHDTGLEGAQWNQDETQLLTWSDEKAWIWNAPTGELLHTFSPIDRVGGVQWSHDARRLLTLGRGNTAQIWDTTTGRSLFTLSFSDMPVGAHWNKDESRILTWGLANTAEIWDARNGKRLHTFNHEYSVDGAEWSPDETRLITFDGFSSFVWDIATGKLLFTLTAEVWQAGWSQNGNRILTWGSDHMARLWDATNGNLLLTFSHEDFIGGARWNANETQILTWSSDHSVLIWNAQSSALLPTLSHRDLVSGAQWSPDESLLLTWSKDNTVSIWDTQTSQPRRTIPTKNWVSGALWDQSAKRILTWSSANSAQIWDATNGKLLLSLPHAANLFGAQWNQDATRVLTWSYDTTAKVWDAQNGNLLLTLKHDSAVSGAHWSQDPSRLLTWSGNSATLWHVANAKPFRSFLHVASIRGVEWSPDESRLLTWSDDHSAKVWNSATGELLLTLPHQDFVISGQWNQDATQILTRDLHSAQVWDAYTGKPLQTYTYDTGINGLRWNQDATRIVMWGWHTPTRIWDTGTGQLRQTFFGDDSEVINVIWNQAESQILLTTEEGHIYRYYTHLDELLAVACTRATRNLTLLEWQQYLPAGESYHTTCPNLPIHASIPATALTPAPTPTTISLSPLLIPSNR